MRRLPLLLALLPAVACGPEPTVDDWGTAGYARLEGTVSAADGSLLRGLELYVFCGRDAPDEFGNGPTYSDARGAYRLDVAASGLLYQPVDTGLVLVCRARAAGPPPGGPIADSTLRIRFMPTQAGLAPTIVDLRVRGQP